MRIFIRLMLTLTLITYGLSYDSYTSDSNNIQKTAKDQLTLNDQDDNSLFTTQVIDGDPLDITVSDAGMINVVYNNTQQYFSPFRTFLFLNGTTISNLNNYTAVSNDQPDPWTIVTVLDDNTSNIRITQTISYTQGSKYYTVNWSLVNNSGNTYTDCRLIHGGDTYFGGFDSSEGHYDASLGMVYLTNPDPNVDGLMGFYGHPSTPADHYFEGYYGSNYAHMQAGMLPDSVNGSFLDAGYSLQWNNDTFSPGTAWSITAYEKWTAAGTVQVIAPAPQTANSGETVNYNFIVQNLQNTSDTFNLSVQSSQGWSVSLANGSSIVVEAASSASVSVNLTIPDLGVGTYNDVLTLTATSQSDGEVTNNDAVTTTVEVTDIPGCTDSNACNYNPDATVNDGSCVAPAGCNGWCAGDDGGPLDNDCSGTCGGDAFIDDCGVCDGNNQDMDCAGVCNGDSVADACGVCDNDSSNDNADMDCAGDCFGSAFEDICEECVEGSTGLEECTGETLLYFGDVNYQDDTIDIRMTNEAQVFGFQFQIEGSLAMIDITDVSGGVTESEGFNVEIGGDNIVIGFSYDGESIPAGDNLLVTLHFDGCSNNVLCITYPEIAGVGPMLLPVEVGDCIDFASEVGDVNFDGQIDIVDITVIISIIFGDVEPNNCQFVAADVFTDNNISVIDIVDLVQIILGGPVAKGNSITNANLVNNNGELTISSDGDIAGLQIEYIGNFEISQSFLSPGWEVHYSDNTMLIFSTNGTSLQGDMLFSYTGEFDIVSNTVADWQGNSVTASLNSLMPSEYVLHEAYPNPFNPVTSISFELAETSNISLLIYDMNGREISSLANGVMSAGYHNIKWNAQGYSSGIYFVKMVTSNSTMTQKIILMK
jgi:hypothetical protein